MRFKNNNDIIDLMTNQEDNIQSDYLKHENSNFIYGLPLVRHQLTNNAENQYLLEKVFPKELVDLYNDGVIYIHDRKLAPYCNSVSCKDIATKGIPTLAKNMIASKPTKRTTKLLRHFSNVVTLMSQQVSGAVMLSQMTTVLASYLFYENEAVYQATTDTEDFYMYEEVKQDIESLIWELNMPLRAGSQCVTEDTEILTPNGFKKYNEIFAGDAIYTWKNGELNIQPIQRMNISDYDGVMHSYIGRDITQIVTPNHRVLHQKNNSREYILTDSSKLFNTKTPTTIPVAMLEDNRPDYEISDDMLKLLVIVLTDGHIMEDGRIRIFKSPKRYGNALIQNTLNALNIPYTHSERSNGFNDGGIVNTYSINSGNAKELISLCNNTKKEIPRFFSQLSRRQAKLVINLWAKFDGHTEYTNYKRQKLQCDNYAIADQLQHICFLAGMGSRITSRIIGDNQKETIYLIPYKRINKHCNKKELIRYKGKVWCPTTEDGVVVFRKDGKIFISGNSPFSNITLEFTASDEIKDEYIVIGGEVKELKYSEIPRFYFDVINKIIIDIMAKGNNGIPFTFPLITVQMTDNFDLENKMFLYLLEQMYSFGGIYMENFKSKPFNNPYYKNKNPLIKAKDPEVSRSMCCRLNISLETLSRAGGGIFGSSTGNTGAVQVLNLNINRILLEAKAYKYTEAQIMARIYEVLRIMQEGHQAKRKFILANKELYPTFFSYNKDLNNFFNVFAVTGMHEALINYGYCDGLNNEEGKDFAHKIMLYISNIIDEFIIKDKVACGIEYA